MTKVKELLGKTLVDVIQHEAESIVFRVDDGSEYWLFHQSDCCEWVSIEDVNGDFANLIGSPLTMADESSNHEDPADVAEKYESEYRESFTWTFYKFATVKGYVDIRWYGTSNGYYSEVVSFAQTKGATK